MTSEHGLSWRLADWRRSKGWTQIEAAASCGIPRRTWVGYENAERQPGADALASLARAGCDVAWLLTGQRTSEACSMIDARALSGAMGCTDRAIRQRAAREGWTFVSPPMQN